MPEVWLKGRVLIDNLIRKKSGWRIAFSNYADFMGKKARLHLDPTRIREIRYSSKDSFYAGSTIYILYETDKVDYYKPYIVKESEIPEFYEPINRFVATTLVCGICGREVDWDADEPFCPIHGQENLTHNELIWEKKNGRISVIVKLWNGKTIRLM